MPTKKTKDKKIANENSEEIYNPDLRLFKDVKELRKACIILSANYDSIKSFYQIYRKLRDDKTKGGSPTDQEQDLLRAMLLFAGAGVDSVIKRLIEDGLEKIVLNNEDAKSQLIKFVDRKIKKNISGEDEKRIINPKTDLDINLIASLIVSDDPKRLMIESLKVELTENSLQSKQQLLEVSSKLAITPYQIMDDQSCTQDAFVARNEIMHEMDAFFEQRNKRSIRLRKRDLMLKYTNNLIKISESFIKVINERIPK